jgi:hypothetical protein
MVAYTTTVAALAEYAQVPWKSRTVSSSLLSIPLAPTQRPNENFKPIKSDLGLQHDSNFCVIQVDTHLRVKYWNLAAANFTEVAPRQAIGKSLVDLPDMGCKRLLHNMLKVWFELAYLLEGILAM